jgi:glycerophosphoryl diester phosphodiesterase
MNYKPLILFGLLLFQGSFFLQKHSENRPDGKPLTRTSVAEQIQKRAANEILVCAHRGFHEKAPENSLQSVVDAINASIDIIEVDVRTTKDGVLILMHDETIDRTTDGSGRVNSFTWNELQRFGLTVNDSVTGYKIPMLSDVLRASKNRIIVNLDIKHADVNVLYKELTKWGMQHEVFSFTGSEKDIADLIAIDPHFAVLPLVRDSTSMRYYAGHVKSKLQHFTNTSFTAGNMKWARENGVLVFMNSLWEVDAAFVDGKTASMDAIIALRPAIIQTDHPALLLNYLKSKNLHQ